MKNPFLLKICTILRICSLGMCFSVVCVQAALHGAAPPPAMMNTANNPLAPKVALQFQDYYQPVLQEGKGDQYNEFMVRNIVPYRLFGLPKLMRWTLPVMATSQDQEGSHSGLGDFTIFDDPVHHFDWGNLGIGPLLVAPTATSRSLGQGKWQAGAEGVLSSPQKWGLLALLVNYQQSFAGDSGRRNVQELGWQPFVFYNLAGGFYLRSSGVASIDFTTGNTVIPVGLGIGHVHDCANGDVVNLYIEPQLSAVATGPGAPRFQLFVGCNIQFPSGTRLH